MLCCEHKIEEQFPCPGQSCESIFSCCTYLCICTTVFSNDQQGPFEVLCTTVCTTSSRIISFGYYCISSEFVHLRTFIHNCNCDTVSNHPACGQMYCTVINHQVYGLRYIYSQYYTLFTVTRTSIHAYMSYCNTTIYVHVCNQSKYIYIYLAFI